MVEYFKGVKKEVSRIKWTSKKDLLKYYCCKNSWTCLFPCLQLQ